MTPSLQQLARQLLPPLVSRPLAQRFLGIRYTGNYDSWAAAKQASTGYDTAEIHVQVLAASRSVREGQAAFERDGVAFIQPECRWPLLTCLLLEAAKRENRLRVLDFGGSLGSCYFQHRHFLSGLKELRWAVVEQPMFVETGRQEFSNAQLSFHPTIDEAVKAIQPDVFLFSGVLGWIEHPHALLDEVVARKPAAILVDRTPFSSSDRDVAKVQRVPAKIYRASYPCWFLSRAGFIAHFRDSYRLRAELPQFDAPVPGADFGGCYFERATN